MDSIYLTPERELLREQVARLVAREVESRAGACEDAGFTPRDVLRRLGGAGLLGLTYKAQYGGGATEVMLDEAAKRATEDTTPRRRTA